jgi:hypothetical protein
MNNSLGFVAGEHKIIRGNNNNNNNKDDDEDVSS